MTRQQEILPNPGFVREKESYKSCRFRLLLAKTNNTIFQKLPKPYCWIILGPFHKLYQQNIFREKYNKYPDLQSPSCLAWVELDI